MDNLSRSPSSEVSDPSEGGSNGETEGMIWCVCWDTWLQCSYSFLGVHWLFQWENIFVQKHRWSQALSSEKIKLIVALQGDWSLVWKVTQPSSPASSFVRILHGSSVQSPKDKFENRDIFAYDAAWIAKIELLYTLVFMSCWGLLWMESGYERKNTLIIWNIF